MSLPEKIQMRTVSFMDGRGGWAAHEYENAEFGIKMHEERRGSGFPFIARWTMKAIPGRIFTSYKDLRETVEILGLPGPKSDAESVPETTGDNRVGGTGGNK